jgi:cytochrome P450
MPDNLPPGPNLPPLLMGALMAAGTTFVERWHRRYGDRFTLRLGRFGTYVYLADPDDIRTVFHGDDAVFHAGEANAPFLGRVLGPMSVLVTDEDLHLRQRRSLAGPFHGASVARLVPRMEAVAAADVDTWPTGVPFKVISRTKAITLEVILQAVIGVTDEDRLAELRSALLRLVDIGLLDMAQFVFPSLSRRWPWRRFAEVKARADRLLYREIALARADPGLDERPDVLAMMVRQGEMGDDEVRDQLATLLLAGHETTATGLAWAMERLVRHPAILEEATAAARSGDDSYLDAVVAETLRCRPVVPDVSRLLASDFQLGPYLLPAGTYVDPAIALVHRSSARYPEPERFDPGRFAARRPDPTIWLPFGGGSRRCLGAAFAATEMRVVLSQMLRRVDLEPTDAPPEKPRVRHVTLAPSRGGTIVVRARRGVPQPAGAAA